MAPPNKNSWLRSWLRENEEKKKEKERRQRRRRGRKREPEEKKRGKTRGDRCEKAEKVKCVRGKVKSEHTCFIKQSFFIYFLFNILL